MGLYDDDDAVARYQEHRHGGVSSPNHVMEEPALRRELGDVHGMRIADLGCGDAAIAGDLIAAGAASYLGVDSSAGMVESARKTLPQNSTVLHGAIEEFSPEPGSLDLIISRLALHYVADLDAVLIRCVRALTAGGRLVVTVVHPVLTAAQDAPAADRPRTTILVDDYFSPGPRERPWMGGTVTWYHRTVEDHLRALTRAGLTLTALSECAPDPDRFDGDDAELARRRRVPMFLLLSARRPY